MVYSVASEERQPELKNKSLLSKYEIPIDHLSYEYIGGCSCVKELERIVKILRSGEEGYFPDLQTFAEDRLRNLNPNNRLLRTEVPALNKSCFNGKEWGNILDDIGNWKKTVSEIDKQLHAEEDCDNAEVNTPPVPPVRQPLLAKPSSGSLENKVQSKRKVSDYAFWDKYDVDTELLKLDLEEERKNLKDKIQTKETEKDRLDHVVPEAKTCSQTEKEILAEKEKLRGNEFYQAKDYQEAEKYYTASLAIYPTAKAYNNRASCNLKQNKYSAAIQDADSTLELEPNNIKALYRKGVALKYKNEFKEALQIMKMILKQEPNHCQAQIMTKQLTEIIRSETETTDSTSKNFEQTENERIKKVSEKDEERNRCFEVNEWGLPKTLCPCSGVIKCNVTREEAFRPTTLSSPAPSCDTENKPRTPEIVELADKDEPRNEQRSTKLEIVEIETLPHGPSNDFSRPKKCNVVDMRSQKARVIHGEGDM